MTGLAISVRGVWKAYDRGAAAIRALDGVDLDVRGGGFSIRFPASS